MVTNHTSISTTCKYQVVTLQYNGSIWLPLVNHACYVASETEDFLTTSLSVLKKVTVKIGNRCFFNHVQNIKIFLNDISYKHIALF